MIIVQNKEEKLKWKQKRDKSEIQTDTYIKISWI